MHQNDHMTLHGSSTDLIDSMEDVVIVQQNDPNSPLHSIKSFEDLELDEDLLKGVYNAKFIRPSKIQEHALPLLLRRPPEHLIAQAQSGTGKTAAFSLAILKTLDYTDPKTQALILAPTRELAAQIVTAMGELAKYTSAIITPVLRDTYASVLPRDIKGQIIVGTPGRVADMIKRRALNVAHLKMLVLDEADFMLDLQGLGPQSLSIKRLLPQGIQLVLFSATWDESVMRFADNFINGPRNQIRLPADKLTVETIKQFFIDCEDEEDRFEILVALYSIMTISQSIIFVERRDTADKIAQRMKDRGHEVSFLHGYLTPDERDKKLEGFRNMRSKVLITTNVLARGIDISTVNLVINYDLPKTKNERGAGIVPDPVTYLHRIGRTGRFGRQGVCVNFIHDCSSHDALETIAKHLQCPILRVPIAPLEKYGSTLMEQKSERIQQMEEFFRLALKGT